MIEPRVIKNVFSDDIVQLIKMHVRRMKLHARLPNNPLILDDKEFHRWHVHNYPLFTELHQIITPRFNEWVGMNLKPSYCFGSFYLSDGICPPHVDREQCVLTLDYCISQKEPWPIYVNHVDKVEGTTEEQLNGNADPYLLNENDGVIFSGTEHWHYRDRIQQGNYCDLIFFHFVEQDFRGSLE